MSRPAAPSAIPGPLARLLGPAVAVAGLLAGASAAQAECGKVTIAEMTWNSAAVLANVEKIVLNEGYGCMAELVPGDTVPTVTSMTEKAEPDIAPEIWINSSREVVEKAVAEGRLKIATEILADGGVEGWWVPAYLVEAHPELKTLEGVRGNPDMFPDREEPGKARFYGCPAGWACEIVNNNLFKAYGMDEAGFVTFNPGSGEGLAAAIAKAYERREPIFTYYWAPTSVLGKYEMVKLDGMEHDPETWECIIDKDCADPKPNQYPKSVVMTVTTASFAESAPDAYGFIESVSIGNAVLNKVLAWQDDNQATAEDAAMHFLETYPEVWTEWVPAAVADKVKAGL